MNKYKQVIEIFKMENELMEFDPSTGEKKPIELQNEDNQDLYKANLVAIEVLEKQIPKRAKETQEMMDVEYICPICEKVNHNRGRYCWGCGQAITH